MPDVILRAAADSGELATGARLSAVRVLWRTASESHISKTFPEDRKGMSGERYVLTHVDGSCPSAGHVIAATRPCGQAAPVTIT